MGDSVCLQVQALTNHPCGQFSMDLNHPNYDVNYALLNENGNDGKQVYSIVKNSRYSACKPGPSLNLRFTNLVLSPLKVQVEKITGHSAIITWELS
jgi:hypothetical protein